MTLHIGDDNIVDIRKGNTKIAKVYHGSDLVWGYVPGKVLFESSTPGAYSLYVKCRCKLAVIIVGAGGGGACQGSYYTNNYTVNVSAGGGSGAYINGIIEVYAGTYQVVVGGAGGYVKYVNAGQEAVGGNGGASSVFGQVAGGGFGGHANTADGGGNGGVVQTITSGINGIKGSKSGQVVVWGDYPAVECAGGSSRYGGYGAGGNGNGTAATGGYIKIVAI